jgi:hypothetical protein
MLEPTNYSTISASSHWATLVHIDIQKENSPNFQTYRQLHAPELSDTIREGEREIYKNVSGQ